MIFLSHSSRDHELANRIFAWLQSKNLNNVFLDIDRFAGLLPGDSWPDKLRDAHKKSSAYLFIITRNWLDSSWCRAEYQAAHLAGKLAIPLLCDSIERHELPPEMSSIQICDLHSDWNTGLSRLENALILAIRGPSKNNTPDLSDITNSQAYSATGTVASNTGGIAIGAIAGIKVIVADKIDMVNSKK